MEFSYSPRCQDYLDRLRAFMDAHIYPNEATYAEQLAGFGENRWQVIPVIEELKEKAKALEAARDALIRAEDDVEERRKRAESRKQHGKANIC